MSPAEKELLIQMLANVDDVVAVLSDDQKETVKKSTQKIYANYYNLMEGVR